MYYYIVYMYFYGGRGMYEASKSVPSNGVG